MSRTSIYLNFMGNTEEAFQFYQQVFGTELSPCMRMGDVPAGTDQPSLPDHELNKVMHIQLPILGGLVLMGTDMLESMGHELQLGNNISINLEPDTRAETDKLFKALSANGEVTMPLQEMFWGDYFGSCIDPFGIRWMFNCGEKA